MKKTQRKDALRNILRQKAAWFSMVSVILVGITGLLLASGIGASLTKTAEEYYAATRFRDAEIVYALGFSEDSVQRLAALEQVEELEGCWSFTALMQRAGEEGADPALWPVHVLSRTERISTPVLAEGRLPEIAGECALDEALAERCGLRIGDRIELQGDRIASYRLSTGSAQIVGLIHHPHAVTKMRADTVLLPQSAFNASLGYTGVLALLRVPEEARARALSDGYLALSDQQTEALKAALPEIAEARILEVRAMLESDLRVRLALATKGLTLAELEGWLAGENPDWDTAPRGVLAARPELESALESLGMDLPTVAALYREVMASEMVVQDRRMNEGYEYLRSMQQTIARIGLFLAPLFALVASIVFFSSTLILISDQRSQVGAMKAIGFDRRSIRRKYLVFGLSAALIGSAAGVAVSLLTNAVVLRVWNDQFSIGGLKASLSPLTVALILLPALCGAALVVFAACGKLLRCSAVGLIGGSEPRRKSLTRRAGKARKRSLYSELILNNIRTEKPRAATTVIVIALSVLLIGASVTLRQNLRETFRIQAEDVTRYRLTVSVSVTAGQDDRAALEEILTASGAEWAAAYQGGVIAQAGGGTFGCAMLCMEREQIREYFNVSVPEGGVAVSYNLADAYGLKNGDALSLSSRFLNFAETSLAGVFEYHIGNLLVLPADTYRALYGVDCGANCYLVKCPQETVDILRAALGEYNRGHSDRVSVETVEESMRQFQSIQGMYDLLAGVTIVLVAAMNLLILVNLTHILISRRMKDLLLMRVNGFSMRQVSACLFREMLYTALPGIALGVAAGIPFTLLLLRRISTMKITLAVRTVWYAWVIAAVLCAAFALIVYRVAFRRVRQASLVSIPR